MDVDPFVTLARALQDSQVRYLVIGVWGANYYAASGSTLFTTDDRDLFLPPAVDNLVQCWAACEGVGFALETERGPLDKPLRSAARRSARASPIRASRLFDAWSCPLGHRRESYLKLSCSFCSSSLPGHS